jgi:hypothetical protein
MLLRPYRHPRPDDNESLINSQAETPGPAHFRKPCLSLPCKTSLRDGTSAEIVFSENEPAVADRTSLLHCETGRLMGRKFSESDLVSLGTSAYRIRERE